MCSLTAVHCAPSTDGSDDGPPTQKSDAKGDSKLKDSKLAESVTLGKGGKVLNAENLSVLEKQGLGCENLLEKQSSGN